MKFKNAEHQQGYERFIRNANLSSGDVERISLFYLLSMFQETRKNINTLYNFKENHIEFKGLNSGWQTSGTMACCKLAFNLFNSFDGFEDDEAYNYTVINIFAYAGENKDYFIEAIKLRFEMI